jgi:4-amino-4-deoxy-L-arabinose transferase-like glycosyltransferase
MVVLLLSAVLMFTCLGLRRFNGPEDRWAVVAREMVSSGDYFHPTINGIPYWDKPLLSYWMILPFAWIAGGVSEATMRLPSAIAGYLTVVLAFMIGRRLFGRKTGFWAGVILATSGMFTYWSRFGSADSLNVFFIWLAFWVFIAGAKDGKLRHVIGFYCVCALSAFIKGLIAPAVVISVAGFYSLVSAILDVKTGDSVRPAFKDALYLRFRWLASRQGAAGVLCGAVVFAALFFLPVLVTGSWQSAELMWRENITRFFEPFDHKEPVYVYLWYSLMFFLPWSIILLSAIWGAGKWAKGESGRLILLIAAGIFLFFTASGSRRSYYILPLLPALAIITAKSVTDWLGEKARQLNFTLGAVATGIFFLASGTALLVAFFAPQQIAGCSKAGRAVFIVLTTTPLLLGISVSIIAATVIAGIYLAKNRKTVFIALLAAMVFGVEFWGITAVTGASTRAESLTPFCSQAGNLLKSVPDEEIALFKVHRGPLIYYLDRGPLPYLQEDSEVRAFARRHPGGFIICERNNAGALVLIGVKELLRQEQEDAGKVYILLKLVR